MRDATDHVFRRYKRFFAPLALLLMLLVGWPIVWFGNLFHGVLEPLVKLPLLAVAANYLVTFGNGWLRKALHRRLNRLGEVSATDPGEFVGLAHPCHSTTALRRVVETDDDVGFLRFTATHLIYRGDRLTLDIPLNTITAITVVHSFFAPQPRVQVTIAGGEPFDKIVLDVRRHLSWLANMRENHRLRRRLQGLVAAAEERREPVGARLTTDDVDHAVAGNRTVEAS